MLESAVFGVPDAEWGEAVKAVVVLKPGTSATEQEIIATAAQHLASYQKPRSVDFVDSLPKAPTGKILKRALRAPYWDVPGEQGMSALLSDELLANIGRSAPPQRELVTRRDIRKYAVATGNRQRKYLDGDQAPPMFHVPLFWDSSNSTT